MDRVHAEPGSGRRVTPAFDRVWGQDPAVEQLEAGLREARLAPALILHGPEGVGKTYLALLLARALLCPAEGPPPCGRCPTCLRTDPPRTGHPDLREIRPVGREIRIQQVREMIREIQVRPLEARRRVFLIEPADRLTTEAANALLKVLEEPPPSGALLLVTPAFHSLLPTVRSRCQAVRLQPVSPETVVRHLTEVRGLGPDDARLVAALTEGRIARAAGFDLGGYRKRRERLLEILRDLRSRRYASAVLRHAEQMAHSAEELGRDLDALLLLFRDVTRIVHGPAGGPIANRDLAEDLQDLSRRFAHRSHRIVERIDAARRDLLRSVNRYLATQVLLFELAGSGRGAEGGWRLPAPPLPGPS